MNPGLAVRQHEHVRVVRVVEIGEAAVRVGPVLSLGDHEVIGAGLPVASKFPDSGPKWMPGAALRWSW